MLLTACALVSAACQHAPPAEHTARWQRDQARFAVSQIPTVWQYDAKVGVRTPRLSEQANLIWRFRDLSNQVRLFGPFGAGAITIEYDQFGVELSDQKGVRYRGSSAEQLLTEIVGWPIPVEALSAWLWGEPLAAHPYEYQLGPENRLRALRQLGWRIDYADYQLISEMSNGRLMPKKVTARKRHEGGEIRIRLISKHWQW